MTSRVPLPLLGIALLAASACSDARSGRRGPAPTRRPPPEPAVYEAEVAEGIGAAIAIVVDTSGSMKRVARGDTRPKHLVARLAIEKMLSSTAAFQKKKPDFSIRVGVLHFSSDVWPVLPIRPYDHETVVAALRRIPAPGGGTAIGRAMQRARQELYRGGVYRKYMVVVTDGENRSGPDPARVAREIQRRSEGSVNFYFVAFDTDPRKFGFLREVGGEVVRARNGEELEAALKEIYEGKILAEADYGETELYDPRQKKGTPR